MSKKENWSNWHTKGVKIAPNATPLKINLEHNQGGLEDQFSFPNGWFVGSILIFQGCMGEVPCSSCFHPPNSHPPPQGPGSRTLWLAIWSPVTWQEPMGFRNPKANHRWDAWNPCKFHGIFDISHINWWSDPGFIESTTVPSGGKLWGKY